MTAAEELERGRRSYAERSWREAHEQLARADDAAPLEREDLELLATAAYMLGRSEQYFGALERAHQAHLDAGEGLRAARCALWIGVNLAQAGEMGRAGGWLARAQRLVEREGRECVEQGYLLLPRMFQQEAGGDLEAAIATAAEAAAIGERFGDRDLFALAAHSQGHMLAIHGDPGAGLALLDEAMLSVSNGELSPVASGIVYCGVILGCQAAFDLRRAREWTIALDRWCEQQPDMVAFTGRCMVHRAEILQLEGTWPAALKEARRAVGRCLEGENRRAAGEAAYLEGEVMRLQGDFERAERAYREANECGREPQPGLALMRLAQGDSEAAAASIRRALAESSGLPGRAALLAGGVEILLALGELEEARGAVAELERIAAGHESGLLDAVAMRAAGAADLAAGDAEAALPKLRRSLDRWQEVGAPYEAGRVQELVARACRALGDRDAAEMSLSAAGKGFAELGAAPDLARVEALAAPAAAGESHGLTDRELEVLTLVAGGATNKAIAAELVLSERTVERHVSNIFAKLGVPSRAAATAFAYEHRLL